MQEPRRQPARQPAQPSKLTPEDVHPNRGKAARRVAGIIGRLEDVKGMVANGGDCVDILIQLSVARSALDGAAEILLNDHINHCLKRAYEKNDTAMAARASEAISKFLAIK
jgi:DNA-binding FrmR family transcriptional regulator